MFSMVSQLLKPAINLLFIVICTFQKGKFLFSDRILLTTTLYSHFYELGFFFISSLVTQHDLLQSD